MPKEKKPVLNICHLYPDLLNLYGDRGNVFAFMRRCQWRGIEARLHNISLTQEVDFNAMDFLFLGGGSDREQNLMARDLEARARGLARAVDDGLVVLAICGGYQLMGKYYLTLEGDKIPGLGILELYTEAGTKRLIGNVAVEVSLGGKSHRLVGFENHSGRTYLEGTAPLGRVLSGHGNNGEDCLEGTCHKNVFCSYLHGPLLPKNPFLTDHLISLALARRAWHGELAALDDSLEQHAAGVMLARILKS